MILCLHLHERKLAAVLTDQGGSVLAYRDASWRVGSGVSMATHVEALLSELSCTPSQINGVVVAYPVTGSYTTVRSMLAFANGLGWSLGCPLAEVNTVLTAESLAEQAPQCLREKAVAVLFPTYSGDPAGGARYTDSTPAAREHIS